MKHRYLKRTGIIGILLSTILLYGCGQAKRPLAALSTPRQTREQIEQSSAPVTLVHVWATWCQPCREEFPELLKVYHDFQNSGLELKLISADDPGELAAVESFLLENDSPIDSLVSTELSQEFIELFSPNWSGALPASFFFDAKGKLVAEWEGKRSYEAYAETIEGLLKP